MLCSPFYSFKNNFQKQTNDKDPFLMSKVDDPVKCSVKLSKIMYVIATIYKILGVTETDFGRNRNRTI